MRRPRPELLLCLIALSACGSALPSPSPTAMPERQKPAGQIIADSRSALSLVSSVQVLGTIDIGAHRANLDVTDAANGRGEGTVIVDAVQVQGVLVDDVFYMHGPKAVAQFEPADVAGCVGDRWVVPPPSAGYGPILRFFDVHKLGDALLSLPAAGARFVADDTVHGRPALRLEDGGGRVLFVAAVGPPLPLRISRSAANQAGNLDFINYGAPVSIAVPSKSVDLSNENATCAPAPAGPSPWGG